MDVLDEWRPRGDERLAQGHALRFVTNACSLCTPLRCANLCILGTSGGHVRRVILRMCCAGKSLCSRPSFWQESLWMRCCRWQGVWPRLCQGWPGCTRLRPKRREKVADFSAKSMGEGLHEQARNGALAWRAFKGAGRGCRSTVFGIAEHLARPNSSERYNCRVLHGARCTPAAVPAAGASKNHGPASFAGLIKEKQ